MDTSKDLRLTHLILAVLLLVVFTIVPYYQAHASFSSLGGGASPGLLVLYEMLKEGEMSFFLLLALMAQVGPIGILVLYIRKQWDEKGLLMFFSLCPFAFFLRSLFIEHKDDFILISSDTIIVLSVGAYLYGLIAVALPILAGFINYVKQETTGTGPSTPKSQEKDNQATDFRTYSDERLQNLMSDAKYCTPDFLRGAEQELQLRRRMEYYREEVAGMTNEKISSILGNNAIYDEALIRLCSLEQKKRQFLQREEARKKDEQTRLARENERQMQKEARKARRIEWWLKWRWYLAGTAVMALCVAVFGYYHSDGYYFSQGMAAREKMDREKAMEYFSKVSDTSSAEYAESQYYLALYYEVEGDLQRAGQAYQAAAQNGKYADACLAYANILKDHDKAREMGLVSSLKEAAECLAKSEDLEFAAAEIFFQLKDYDRAYAIINKEIYKGDSSAEGYIGLAYLYGLDGKEKNLSQANQHLMNAPIRMPFAVHQGDLTLYYNNGSWGTSINKVEKALSYYEFAYDSEGGKLPEIENRVSICRSIIIASKEHGNKPYWEQGPVYWMRWDFSSGSGRSTYNGENSDRNGMRAPNGWGVVAFGNREMVLAHFNNSRKDGLGMYFTPDGESYHVFVGEFKDDQYADGITYYSDGRIEGRLPN